MDKASLDRLRTMTRSALLRARELQVDRLYPLPAAYTAHGTPLSSLPPSVSGSPKPKPKTAKQRSYLTSEYLETGDPVIDVLLRDKPPVRSSARQTSPARSRPRFNTSPRISSVGEKAANERRALSRLEQERISRRSPSPIFQFHTERLKYTVDEVLSKDDAYYQDMQQFRILHPDLCINELEGKIPERRAHLHPLNNRNEHIRSLSRSLSRPSSPIEVHDINPEYHRTGFFTINDRLFPERAMHSPFMNNNGISAVDEPPVKVSIPLSKLSTQSKTYKPHRRNSFDPSDSLNIATHLHKGYETAGALSNKSRFSDGRLALRDHVKGRKKQHMAF
ncbi:hypothetical protein BDR26DRAFT_1006324 [Obelidium mucronatum]|nr:hypothetical protein BDR26DRAFT_1006324 [Obelidium mucronatum]